MKRIMACILCLVMVLSLVGCDVKTRDDVEGGSGGEKLDTIPLTLLGQAANQKDLNVIRDLLTQQGFDVTINMQPDRGAYMSQIDAGNYDITFTGWASISGNGDYATRGIFHSTGDSNLGGNIHDERLDALIDEACTLVYDESVPLYAEIEQILLDEAYIAPLYVGRKVEAYNKDVVDGDTIGIYAATTVGEETTGRGAYHAAARLKPHCCIAVDVTWASDAPGTNPGDTGEVKLGGGPVLCMGSAVNKPLNALLKQVAEELDMKVQWEIATGRTGTDGDTVNKADEGVPMALVSIPLRYMHSSVEVGSWKDIEDCIRLLSAFLVKLSEEMDRGFDFCPIKP